MRLRGALSFAMFGAIIAFAVGVIVSFGVRIGLPAHRTNLSMAVPDIKGLVVGSNVLLRGEPVGKVTEINTATSDATVQFYIDGDHRIPVDTDVRLDNLSALGEAYIGLAPRTSEGPMFKDGQRISTKSIEVPPSISQLATSSITTSSNGFWVRPTPLCLLPSRCCPTWHERARCSGVRPPACGAEDRK
jgi:phospholipid/cholesterol/gamma-HCH transport system substrate-binding protein